ncbi:MAG: trypsin-like serine protease [Solirubrobacterales bacterium]
MKLRAFAGISSVMSLLVFFLPASAGAASPTFHVLSGGRLSSLAAQPLTVPGRAPARRFLGSSLAGASSLRIGDTEEVGTRTNGKILGVTPGEGDYSCSGTALNTPSRSIVLTAGHCVIEHGRAGRHIVFVPAYDEEIRPFGSFSVESVYVMPQWLHGENPDYDVAALRVSPNQFGYLTEAVGARGYAASQSRFSAFQIFGYPAAALGGETLRSCRAHGQGSDLLTDRFSGPPTLPAPCDMADGASGGAWLVDGEYVDGVTSYGYAGQPTKLYSSYFGPLVGQFLKRLP